MRSIGRTDQLLPIRGRLTIHQAKKVVVAARETAGSQAGRVWRRSTRAPSPGKGPKPTSAGSRYQ